MSNFETWWEREGQEFLYALNTTTDDDIKLVAEVAWKNGAYCAEQAEQEPVAVVEDWPTDKTPKGIVALGDIKELPAGTLLYASPAISTEVFTREKVDSLLIAAYAKGRNDLLENQAEQEPVAWMWACAECGTEAEDGTDCRICGSCGYHKFYKAPKVATYVCEAASHGQAEQEPVCFVYDLTPQKRNDFINDGFEPTDPLYTRPVRTKDLTNDEISRLWYDSSYGDSGIDFARAVIAADREKNK